MTIMKRLTISLPTDVFDRILEVAEAEHRTHNNWIEHQIIMATKNIEQKADMDDLDLNIGFPGSGLNPADLEDAENGIQPGS